MSWKKKGPVEMACSLSSQAENRFPFLQMLTRLLVGGSVSWDSPSRQLFPINLRISPLVSPGIEVNNFPMILSIQCVHFEHWPNLSIPLPRCCSHVCSSLGATGGKGRNMRGGCQNVVTPHGDRVTVLTTILWCVTVGCLFHHEKVRWALDVNMLLD